MILTHKDAKNLYDALDKASKESHKSMESGPLEPEYYEGRETAFELAKRYVKTWLSYDPEREVITNKKSL